MKLIIFEDKKTNSLFPFCENHAAFEIKVGIYTNLERILFIHKDNDGVCLIVRKEIQKKLCSSDCRFSVLDIDYCYFDYHIANNGESAL